MEADELTYFGSIDRGVNFRSFRRPHEEPTEYNCYGEAVRGLPQSEDYPEDITPEHDAQEEEEWFKALKMQPLTPTKTSS